MGTFNSKIKVIFGVPLSNALKPGKKIPTIIEQCISLISSKCKFRIFLKVNFIVLDVVGIFRLSGSLVAIEQYKKQFDLGKKI
jgi:hypothetical protein